MGSFYTTEPFPGFTSTPKKTYAGTKEFKKLFHLLLRKEKKIKADKNASYLIATDELRWRDPVFFGGVPSYFEALWYPHLYFYRKSNT